jgi:catalase
VWLRREDDDFGQAGTMVRHVLDDAARARLLSNIVGHLKDGISAQVLARTLEYWHKVDKDLGEPIAAGMKDR